MKIVVAEDDPVARLLVTATLKGLGHEVVDCESGIQAWSALLGSNYPVLITDWTMPGMDGLELTEAVRKIPRTSYTYVIMLTGNDTREHYLMGVRAGADAFLVKPLDTALLEAQLSIAARVVGLQNHTHRLESIMTVCSYCKRVRGDTDWVGMEEYIASEFKTLPSHSYCPSCFKTEVEPEMKRLGLSTDDLGLE